MTITFKEFNMLESYSIMVTLKSSKHLRGARSKNAFLSILQTALTIPLVIVHDKVGSRVLRQAGQPVNQLGTQPLQRRRKRSLEHSKTSDQRLFLVLCCSKKFNGFEN